MTAVPTTEVGEREGEGLVAVLQFLDGALDEREVVLEGEATIGRDPSCTVVIPQTWSRVSGLHAKLLVSRTGFRLVEDQGGDNGTFVNDKRLASKGRAMLQPSDVLRFGKAGPSARFMLRSAQYRAQAPGVDYGIVLTVTRGESPTPRLEFANKPLITLGRDPDCELVFHAEGERARVVSKRHARILYRGGKFVLEDLDSANGTLVGGEVVRNAPLHEGDIIEVGAGGPTVVVEAVTGAQASRPAAAPQGSRRWIAAAAAVAVVALVLAAVAWQRAGTEPAEAPAQAPQADVKERAVLQALERRHRASVLLMYSRFELRNGAQTLYTGDSFGTAFVVSPEGLAVTNRHVAQPWIGVAEYAYALKNARAEHGEVEIVHQLAAWPDGTEAFTAAHGLEFNTGFNSHVLKNLEVVGYPPQHLVTIAHAGDNVEIVAPDHTDLALLKLHGIDIDTDAIPVLAEADDALAPLDPVVSLGYPHGERILEGTAATVSPTMGVVRKVEETIQLDASTFPGNSGGPVLARTGKVVGVTTRRFGEGLAVCIPAAKVRALLRAHMN